jgi:hypothetical protein
VLSSILSTCPSHLILCDFMNLTMSSPFSSLLLSSLYCILHKLMLSLLFQNHRHKQAIYSMG